MIEDSRGVILDVNFGLYPYGFFCKYGTFMLHIAVTLFDLLHACSGTCGDFFAEEDVLKSVHSGMYIHYITCYNRCVDEGWH